MKVFTPVVPIVTMGFSFLLLLLSSPSAPSTPVVAQDRYICSQGNRERVIEVIRVNPPAGLPCEVQYTKPSGTQTLWQAEYKRGFCEARAREFADKQEEWGWKCERKSAPTDPAEGATPDTNNEED